MQLEEKQSRRVGWKDPDVGKVCASRDQKEDSVAGACGVSEGQVGRWGGGEVGGGAAGCSESQGPHDSRILSTSKQGQHINPHICAFAGVWLLLLFPQRGLGGVRVCQEKRGVWKCSSLVLEGRLCGDSRGLYTPGTYQGPGLNP